MACLPTQYAIKQRFLIPPVDILCRQADGDDLKLQKSGRADNPQTHVLFTGCKDTQTSVDAYISGAYNGAFTYFNPDYNGFWEIVLYPHKEADIRLCSQFS